jgi:zinc protease
VTSPSTSQVASPQLRKRLLPVTRHQLDNGLEVLVREIPNAAVSGCWTLYRVGSRNERLGITGTSHMVEHMLFKGGGKLGKGDIGNLVSRVGGEYNGFTTKDFTAYYEILPADQIETGLMIEAERMANAAFDPKEVDSERSVMLSEREGNENDPEFQTMEELFLTAYRIHPYRWSEGGLKQDIVRINREDLVDYYHRYYVPSNAVLVVVSPYPSSQVIPKIENYFGGIEAKKPPSHPVETEPTQVGERRVQLRVPSEADYVKVAYHTPSFENEDVYPLIMLDSVLGGIRLFAFGQGMTSGRSLRLYKALVEKKIASYASSEFWPTIDPSVFMLDMTVWDGVPTDKAEKLLLAEVEKIQNKPPGKNELDRALSQVKAQYAYALDGVTRQGFLIGIFELVTSFETMDILVEKLSKVTPERVSEVARKYLSPQNRTICRCLGIRK